MVFLERRLRVFLCHSSADKGAVRELQKRLAAETIIDPWLDEEKLIPGQDWKEEIAKAVRLSDVVLVCLSGDSVSKEGFVQAEIRQALDVADEKPGGTIFIIPAKIAACEVPSRLSRWHWVDLSDPFGYPRLLEALYLRASGLGIFPPATQGDIWTSAFLVALEKTVSNPRYISDLRSLELNDFDLSTLMDGETILVVVGCWLGAELCDRPVAEIIRDEIDKRGSRARFRRAIVVTDTEWFRNEGLRTHPAIAVGGPFANALTSQLSETARPEQKWSAGRLSGAFRAGPPPVAAVWGPHASDVRLSAERYLERPDGLDAFLKLCWK